MFEDTASRLKNEVHKVIVGYDSLLDLLLISFFSSGHVLLEGVPGTAKTLMVKALSRVLSLDFCRISFTPDLMPSDIIGTNVFDLDTGKFHLKKGPVFTNLLLADEINRAPPKTQAALLEAMEERQVTIDGVSYSLEDFMVCATQNPVEYEGTYPLPEAQLDRFMMKIVVEYPQHKEENEILNLYQRGFDAHRLDEVTFDYKVTLKDVTHIREEIFNVKVQPEVIQYITTVVRSTRESPHVLLGASPRASVILLLTSKSCAAMQGEHFVTPDVVKRMAFPVMRHRLILKPEAEIEGMTPDGIIADCLKKVEVPR